MACGTAYTLHDERQSERCAHLLVRRRTVCKLQRPDITTTNHQQQHHQAVHHTMVPSIQYPRAINGGQNHYRTFWSASQRCRSWQAGRLDPAAVVAVCINCCAGSILTARVPQHTKTTTQRRTRRRAFRNHAKETLAHRPPSSHGSLLVDATPPLSNNSSLRESPERD